MCTRQYDQQATPRLDLIAHTVVSSSRPLYSFNVRELQHERVVRWYDQGNNLVLEHFVPRGKVPYTKHGSFEVTYRDMQGLSEIPHGFVVDAATGAVQMLTPYYSFSDEHQMMRFQCAARQKQLLHTFETIQIRTHDTIVSSAQQLKIWQKPGEATMTFTFFAHMSVDSAHHYELDLVWFKHDVKRVGTKCLILTFYTQNDERRESNENHGKARGKWPRRLSFNHLSTESNTRRNSGGSRSSSSSSNSGLLPGGERVVTHNKVYRSWRSLHIEFAHEDDVEQFLAICCDPCTTIEPRLHESHWKASHGFEETIHLLKPVNGSYTLMRRPLPEPQNISGNHGQAVNQARDWFSGFHNLRERYLHGQLEDGIPPVSIAVLDTGIDNGNPDIREQWGNESNITKNYRNFIEDSDIANNLGKEPWTRAKVQGLTAQLQQRVSDMPQDDTGHGTHVAGIIMQLCPEANLFIGRVLASNVTKTEEGTRLAARRLALAILFATECWKVKIISLSIGFRKAFLGETEKAIVRNAIKYATDAGKLIFAAASNEGNRDNILFPAGEPEPFCINSSDGNGQASEYNPPHQEQHENFSILGEGVNSTWLQSPSSPLTGGRPTPTWEVRRGTSVATPIAVSVAALIIHFGRQWEPVGYEKLESRRGIKIIFKSMAPRRNRDRFYDIVPWTHGPFEITTDFRDPINVARERITNELNAAF